MKFALVVAVALVAIHSAQSFTVLSKPGCGCRDRVERIERIEDIGRDVDIEVVRDRHHGDREVIVEEEVVRAPCHRHHLPIKAPCRRPHVPPKPADRIEESVHKSRPEVLIHKPSALLFNRAPTLVRINHSPIVYNPQPVYFHRSADVTHQKTIHKHLDRPVHVRNEVVKIVEPIVEKVLVEKKHHETPCHKKIVEEVIEERYPHHHHKEIVEEVIEERYPHHKKIVEEVIEERYPHHHHHHHHNHRDIELDIVRAEPRGFEEIID